MLIRRNYHPHHHYALSTKKSYTWRLITFFLIITTLSSFNPDNYHVLAALRAIAAGSSQRQWFSFTTPQETTSILGGVTLSNVSAEASLSSLTKTRHEVLAIPGDIIFGGLFPIHEVDTVKGCGKIDPERGIQRLEAMLFTLDKINVNFSHLLPGIRLGALVMDTCGSDYIALERSLEIVQTAAVTDSSAIGGSRGRDYTSCLRQTAEQSATQQSLLGLGLMPGVIGAASSSESIQVASLFRLFRVPMISYASTSAELSDKKRYEYFARTVPSDVFQSKAVIDILVHFDWTYVSVIYSDGDYGSSLFEAFLKRAGTHGICIAHVAKLTKRGEVNEFREHVRALIDKEKARVVVLFTASKDVRQFLKAVTLEIPAERLPYFQFVASDGWGTQKALLSDSDASLASEGAITLEIKTAPLPGFDDYFKRLMANPRSNTRNPWFNEFCETNRAARLQQSYLLSTQEAKNYQNTQSCVLEDYNQDSKNIFVHNAVYAFARALRELQRRHCGRKHIGLCDEMIQNMQAANVFKTILNVTFMDPIGRSVKFDEFGDAVGHYNIYKYRRVGGGPGTPSSIIPGAFNNVTTAVNAITASASAYRFQYDRVGEWNGRLQIARSMRLIVPVINQTKVKSKCSDPCEIGQAMRILVKGCCWECVNCTLYQIVTANASQCIDCEPGYWPDSETRSYCIKLDEKHLDILSWYVILSGLFAFAGMLSTTITIIVYVKFVDTPLVKASSVELSFIILAGCFVTFLTTFFYLSWPSLPICIIRRLSFGLGIASIYSAVAVKINRIYRIFEAAAKSSQQPPMISPESQLMLVACFVGVQLALSVVSLLFDPPDVSDYNPSGDRQNWYKSCATTARSYSLLMALTIILIIGATYYAIRTRNCPEPYREARVVGFSVYTTFIIWLAFVPLFFTTSSSVELQTTVICISLSLCGWVVLVCLFARRIYIIVFQPDKNVKPGKFTLSAAVTKNAAIVTKLALSHPGRESPSQYRSSTYQLTQTGRLSVTGTSVVSRSNINCNQNFVADEDAMSSTTATRALMAESTTTATGGEHYGSTTTGITVIATSAAAPLSPPLPPPPPSASSLTSIATQKLENVEQTLNHETTNTTNNDASLMLINETSAPMAKKSPSSETVLILSNPKATIISPSPSFTNNNNDVGSKKRFPAGSSQNKEEQKALLSASGGQADNSTSEDESRITIDEINKATSNVSRESSEILDEIRSSSTYSSYNMLRKDCYYGDDRSNVDLLLFDRLSSSDIERGVLKPGLLVGVVNTNAFSGDSVNRYPSYRFPVAPIASISSVASTNLPPPGERSSVASGSNNSESYYYDATVIDASLQGSLIVPPSSTGSIIGDEDGTATVSKTSNTSGSQDDITSILERHEQLTTIHGGRIIAICNEAVIKL